MIKIAAVAVALTLAACAQTQQAADWLASDKAQKAAANLKTIAAAIDCGLVVSSAALSKQIAQIVDAGEAANPELSRMLQDLATEREAAGRGVRIRRVVTRNTLENTTATTAATVVLRYRGLSASVPASVPCRLVSRKVA